MKKATKILILLLLLDAALVFVLQVLRTPFAWVFVSLYWAILTIKNYIDWRNSGKKDNGPEA